MESLQDALAKHKEAGTPLTDLVDARFHQNGFVPPATPFMEACEAYFGKRLYEPDSRGSLEARHAISAFCRQGGLVSRGGLEVPADQVILTASTSESYSLIFSTFCEAGDNVLIPLPAYPLFEEILAHCRLEPRYYQLDPDKGWEIDLELLDALHDDKTAFLVLISPNNPCGTVIDAAGARSLGAYCERAGIGLIHDEVFSEFLYAGTPHVRPGALCPQVPTFTLNGISKMLASPDLKLAWICVTGPEAAHNADLLQHRNDTFLSCNSLVQSMLPRLMDTMGPFIRQVRSDLEANRAILADILPALQPWSMRLPSGGIHAILVLDDATALHAPDDESICKVLLDHGLYLHPGWYYGLEDQTCLVMSILKHRDQFPFLVERLRVALDHCTPLRHGQH